MQNAFQSVLISLVEKQRNSTILKVNEGDYEIDGILHCGKCRTAKQVRFMLGDKEIKPLAICQCMQAEQAAIEEEIKKTERAKRISERRDIAFPEADMKNWTFAADDGGNGNVTKIALNYVEHFREMQERGKGLLFYGNVGTGKTFIAAAIVNALIDRDYSCLMTSFPRLINTISGMYAGKQDYLDGLNDFDLLVIDDLAAERDTEYVNEVVQQVIDSRYRSGLPTIITTNLTADEIKNPAQIQKQRTYSRLLEMCIPIEVKGTDRRRNKLKNDYNDLKDLLGL